MAGIILLTAVLLSPSVAYASQPKQLCTTGSFHGCWRDANNANSAKNPVVIASMCSGKCPAQRIVKIDTKQRYKGHEVYRLKFAAHPHLCIGVTDKGSNRNMDNSLETRKCNEHGTAWIQTSSSQWINRGATEDAHANRYACTFRVKGRRVVICTSHATIPLKFTFQ